MNYNNIYEELNQSREEMFEFLDYPTNEHNFSDPSADTSEKKHINSDFLSPEPKDSPLEQNFGQNYNNNSNFYINYQKNEDERLLSQDSHKIQKKRRKWENFSFHIPEYIRLLDPKSQKKEIQKLKNRISAQISRDKKKLEYENILTINYNLEEENKRLLHELSLTQQENQLLLKKLQDFKCVKCGFCNKLASENENSSDTNDFFSNSNENLSNSPIRTTNNLSRASSYTAFLGTLMLLGTIALLCIANPYYINENQMGKVNVFTQINETRTKPYECKNIKMFLKEEREKWKEKATNMRSDFLDKPECWNNYFEKHSDKKLAFPKRKEKFLAKEKKDFPIVPWNYFLDKITTVFCPYPYVLNNNTDIDIKNEYEKNNLIKINGEWLHLLLPQSNYTPETFYIHVDDGVKDYKQYLEIWAKIYGIRELREKI